MFVGDRVVDFARPNQAGRRVALLELLANGPIVLYFYPRAMSPGCTKESCQFRDLAAEFVGVGASRVGVSADSVKRQERFDAKHDFGFPLLSDPDRSIAADFGVRRSGPLPNRRKTFVIGTDSRVLSVLDGEKMHDHANKALEVLRAEATRNDR